MSLENYLSENHIWKGHMPELYCSFSVHQLHPSTCNKDCIRVYVDITHDLVFDALSYQGAMDLTYTGIEYKSLVDAGMLIDNIKMHYLQSEATSRGLDEYFH